MRTVNKRVLESLVKSGAFDSLGKTRAQMMKELPAAMEQGQSKQRDRELGQASLLELFEEEQESASTAENSIPEWNEHDRLKNEKEAIGFYITGHPLERYQKDLSWFTDATSATIAEGSSPKAVSIAGIPIKVLPKTTRKGDKMAIVTLEDLHGSLEVILWPETFAGVEKLLTDEEALLVKGEVDADSNLPKVIAQSVIPLSEAKAHWKGKVHINIRTPGLEKETLEEVKEILAAHKGNNETFIHFLFPDNHIRVLSVENHLRIQPSDEVIHEIESVLGEDTVRFE